MSEIFKKLGNFAVLMVFVYGAWYAWGKLNDAPNSGIDDTQRADYNCKVNLAKYAKDQKCHAAASCVLSEDELADMRRREKEIEEFCN